MKKHHSHFDFAQCDTLRITILLAAVALQFAIFNPPSAISQALPGAGNCLQYDGIDDYVSVPSVQALNDIANTGNSVTYSAWVKQNSATGYQAIFAKVMTNLQPLLEFVIDGGFAAIEVSACASGTAELYRSTTPLTAGTWYHIAVTHTYGNGSSTKIYVNGVLTAGSWVVGTGNNSCNSVDPNPLFIGHLQHILYPDWFNGQIDELCIWNYARTQTEIRDNMCQKLVGNEAGLVGYWRFDETNGNTAFDSSPNGNNGTLW